MEITKTSMDNSVILKVSGKIGNSTSGKFLEEILAAVPQKKKTVLDFSLLEYINSTGLRALLQGLQLAEETGAELIVKDARAEINELFRITGFDELLKIVYA